MKILNKNVSSKRFKKKIEKISYDFFALYRTDNLEDNFIIIENIIYYSKKEYN